MEILTLRNVSKTFGNPNNGVDQVVAVNDVSLELHARRFAHHRAVGLRQIDAAENRWRVDTEIRR
jgi:hypothetical protein